MGKIFFFPNGNKQVDMTEAQAKKVLADKAKADAEHLKKIEKLYTAKDAIESDVFFDQKFQIDIDLLEVEVQNSGEVCVWYNGFKTPEVLYVTETLSQAHEFISELRAFKSLMEEL